MTWAASVPLPELFLGVTPTVCGEPGRCWVLWVIGGYPLSQALPEGSRGPRGRGGALTATLPHPSALSTRLFPPSPALAPCTPPPSSAPLPCTPSSVLPHTSPCQASPLLSAILLVLGCLPVAGPLPSSAFWGPPPPPCGLLRPSRSEDTTPRALCVTGGVSLSSPRSGTLARVCRPRDSSGCWAGRTSGKHT